MVVSSPQSLLVSWLPPTEPNGIITKYNLYTRYVYHRYWSVVRRMLLVCMVQQLAECGYRHSTRLYGVTQQKSEICTRTSCVLNSGIPLSFRMVDGRDELNHGKRNLPSQHTSFESKGLQQHVEYQFWVTASTRVGEGQSSRVVAQVPTVRGEGHGPYGNYVHRLL